MSGKDSKDSLGDRMKADYESRTRYLLPRRTFTLVRVDGRSFHSYTKDCERPYDVGLMADMDATALALCAELTGARLAFVQSDEIQVLLTDFDTPQTQAFFDGSLQKICSIAASVATACFNQSRLARYLSDWGEKFVSSDVGDRPPDAVRRFPFAQFDARVWTIPSRIEVFNAFVWRQQDTTRNAVSMAAQSQFTQGELEGVKTADLQEKLFGERGVNFNDYPEGFKRGRAVVRESFEVPVSAAGVEGPTGVQTVTRSRWAVVASPIFTQDRDWLLSRISDPNAVG